MKLDDDFQKKLLATFQVEGLERVKHMVDGLLRLEKETGVKERERVVEGLFREMHSLKGAAGAVSNPAVERMSRSFEGIFDSLKRGHTPITAELLDLLYRATGSLERLLSNVVSSSPSEHAKIADPVIAELDGFLTGELSSAEESLPPGSIITAPVLQPEQGRTGNAGPSRETVRIAVAKLDSLMLQAEELISAKLAAEQRTADLQSMAREFVAWKKTWRKIHDAARAFQRSAEKNHTPGNTPQNGHDLAGLLDFIESSSQFLGTFEQRLAVASKTSLHDQRSLAFRVENLLEDAKRAIMFPFSSVLETFPRLVRDLARDQKKEVEILLQGTDTEIDRRILENVKDPLIHLMRNCIDHGIEPAEERRRKGKSPRGTVTISVSQKGGNKIEVSVSDDGAGIDPGQIRAAAVKHGIVDENLASVMPDNEALSLIFQSGVSTSSMITDVSGRGLGLAIVREGVEKLGGQVSMESSPGRGTTFRLVLPLTIATFRGILVQSGGQMFVVPAAGIERVIGFRKEALRTVENRETMVLNDEVIPIARLGDILGLPERSSEGEARKSLQAFILKSLNRRIAFVVDAVLQEQEVLVKSLGPQLARLRNIAGATVLGSGRVIPILNVADLVKSAIRVAGREQSPLSTAATGEPATRHSVLVVEDSITARTLLGSILESAGYSVTTAVDGIDALTRLRTGDFDIVVSDVDMPRMNGFDLTAKLRTDKRFTDLPIVLVTALESREDRERGVDVGANAYIVKSSFDQSNLLEVVQRLL